MTGISYYNTIMLNVEVSFDKKCLKIIGYGSNSEHIGIVICDKIIKSYAGDSLLEITGDIEDVVISLMKTKAKDSSEYVNIFSITYKKRNLLVSIKAYIEDKDVKRIKEWLKRHNFKLN